MRKAMLVAVAGCVGLGVFGTAQAEDREGKEKQGKMEVTGPVTNLSGTCPNLQFTVAQQQVTTKDKTEFEDLECTEVANGKAVSVKGKVKDGVLMAYEVEAED